MHEPDCQSACSCKGTSSRPSTVTLEDRDNFRAFKLVVTGNPAKLDATRKSLAGIAELPDDKTAWISEAALRRWEAWRRIRPGSRTCRR